MSGSNRTIEVCLTPALIHLHDLTNATVVVIDVLRATSSMCVAFTQGVKSIIPVATIEESIAYREKGFLIGAERNGEIPGFNLGTAFVTASLEYGRGGWNSACSSEVRRYAEEHRWRRRAYRDWETDRKSTRLNSSHRL